MQQHTVEGNYGLQVEIDACHSCSGFWFDRKEHLQLTPGSTLELIRLMGSARNAPSALPQVLSCPRCGDRLVNTTDIQRNTRFNYFRCPQEDGHFITLFQFLREKNIVRNLELAQIKELRKWVKVIRCSNCGAPISLENESICSYCQSPISMVDPAQVRATLAELQKKEEARPHIDPALAANLAMDKLKVERFYSQLEPNPSALGSDSPRSLIEAGLGALLDILAGR
jgi:transcription elongation factor Elf1